MNILVWLGNKDMHPAIYPNMKSLADAWARMGHNVITCDTSDAEEVMAAISLLREEKVIDLSVGNNALGMKIGIDNGEKLDIFGDLDTLHISILLDEPFNPVCNGPRHAAKRHLLTYLDRSDKEYFSLMNLAQDKYKMFMPLGGTSSGLPLEELLERKRKSAYNVVFSAGKFSLYKQWPEWAEFGAAPAMARVLDDVLFLLQQEALSVMDAAQKVLVARGMEEKIYASTIASFFPLILCYTKAWRRRKLLDELLAAGIELDLFGGDWETGDFSGKVRIHGQVPYAEMLQVFTEAKVVVNDEACFNNGAHDRVFTAMLNGAVVLSEYSSYLAEEFCDGQDLFLFDWQNIEDKLQIIPRLLQDEAYREDIACHAYAKVAGRHTWQQRAERLLEAAEMLEFYPKLQAGNP